VSNDGAGVEQDTIGAIRHALSCRRASSIACSKALPSASLNTVSASEHFGALLLNIRAETVDVAGNFDLLAQRQVLDAPDDGFDDGH
jgi:hypothetical protein